MCVSTLINSELVDLNSSIFETVGGCDAAKTVVKFRFYLAKGGYF